MGKLTDRLPAGAEREIVLLQRALAAARDQARFRLAGADVVIEGLEGLVGDVRYIIADAQQNGLLWGYLGGEEQDDEALDFSDQLNVEPVLIEDQTAVPAILEQLVNEANGNPIGVDIETAGHGKRPAIKINRDGALAAVQDKPDTSGLSPQTAAIATVQLYAGGPRCWVFRGDALQEILRLPWLRNQRLVAHNCIFEGSFFRKYAAASNSGPSSGRLDCSMQAAGFLLGAFNRRLDKVVRALLRGLEVPKALQTSDWGAANLSPGQLCYAASDAILAYRLWQVIEPELHEKGRWDAYRLQMKAVPAVIGMELRGITFDRHEHTEQLKRWQAEYDLAADQFGLIYGIVPRKPAQIRDWIASLITPELLGQLQLDEWPTTGKSGELSTKTENLLRLAHAGIPCSRQLLIMLQRRKMLSGYGEDYVREHVRQDGCISPHYNLGGTKAGRFSASSPNIQQIPSHKSTFRRCFVAREGHVFIEGDYSQVELRVFAEIARLAALRELFAEGKDVHCLTAALANGCEVTKQDPRRNGAKAINFGSICGRGARRLSISVFKDYEIVMPVEEAARLQDAFFQIAAGGRQWMRDNANICQGRGYVYIGTGRVVEAEWEHNSEIRFTQACNLPVQGGAAEVLLLALALLAKQLREAGIRGGLITCVHDSIMLEVIEADAERAMAILRGAMTEAFMVLFPAAPIKNLVEVKIGSNWGDVETIKDAIEEIQHRTTELETDDFTIPTHADSEGIATCKSR
jgi:DNA polymerase-1